MAIALKHKSTKASESDGKKTNGRYWAYNITYAGEIIITDMDKMKFNFILDSVTAYMYNAFYVHTRKKIRVK